MQARAVAYLLLVTFTGCADKLLLHPSTQPADANGADRLVITAHDRRVEVFAARSPGAKRAGEPRAFVLEFCGNATRAEHIASYIAGRWGERPVEVWVMNYPGYGGSTGPASLGAIPRASLETYDALAKRATGRPIFLAGNSMGTTAALYVASERPVAGLILQSPPPLHRIILEGHTWWNLGLVAFPVVLQLPGELNSLATAPHVKAPAVFIQTVQDATVPIKFQQYVSDAYAGPKRFVRVENGGHNSAITGETERDLQSAIDWLWESRAAER